MFNSGTRYGFLFLIGLYFIGCKSQAYTVATDAMLPTLSRQDVVIVDAGAYSHGSVERFDLVFYEMPDSEKKRVGTSGSVRHVKRVVGLPGEKLELRDGVLLINGGVVESPFRIIDSEQDKRRNFGPIVIPVGEYFLLGDNRPQSSDSRYFEPPTIKLGDIHGKVVEVKKDYYPPK